MKGSNFGWNPKYGWAVGPAGWLTRTKSGSPTSFKITKDCLNYLYNSITNKLHCADQSENTIDINQDILWRLKNLNAPKDALKLVFIDATRGPVKQYGYPIDTEPSN